MSRVIKFRAWDPSGIWTDGKDPGYIFDVTSLNIFDCVWHDDDIIKEQFTGLKDKTGVEIYEGDILSDGHFVSEVVFSVDRYCSKPINWKDGYSNLNLWLLKRKKAGCPVSVIGSIHQNPELLEAAK